MSIHFFLSILQSLLFERNTLDLKKKHTILKINSFLFLYHSSQKVKQNQAMENNQHLKHDQV